ncbi:uncharacterized protein TRAVEDRAFT_26304 [Trametes versicolor FP-101664 SS1]|uniref:uncharacterized protein n=1 Tax=Trametes versicolor (strain FP-101664) TaxID=717944 RepID=UPI000462132C|nr:uncharacterized protein TRAVEDRAFT_26304 [Trametes versicolor FP-101664 SS1]EIW62654.1 hypothetical protein TRAVEDRAFT_26304 [Trametes versicolor FP-101664 SS1]
MLEVRPRAAHLGDVGVGNGQDPAPAGDLQVLQGVQVSEGREDVEERGIEELAVHSNGSPLRGMVKDEPA